MWTPERGCYSKRTYLDRSDARRAARLSERRYKREMNAYKCPACRLFHVGGKPETREIRL